MDPVDPKYGSYDSKMWIPWIQNMDPVDPKCGSSRSKMWIHLKMSNNLDWCYYQNIQIKILWIQNEDIVDPKYGSGGSKIRIL